MARMFAGLRIARSIGTQQSLAKWSEGEALPGPGVVDEAALADFLRGSVVPYFHPIGTCRMGDDSGAVVDPELCVRGIEGLRVVDASVMPSIVSGPTNATVLAIAERAAELIRSN